MALPPVGVRLLADDASKFDSALKSAGNVLDGFGKTATAITSSVNSAFAGMASAIGGALAPIGRLLDHIFVSVIRSVVNDAIHQLERFGKAIIDAAIKGSLLETSLERLKVSIESVTNKALAPLVNEISALVDNAAPAFLGFVQFAAENFSQLANQAELWGENFVNQFAQGMWNAIGSILQVLTDIAGMISYWLSPGSPPRLLPDIDKWGTAAASEYFGGWTKGAFTWFSELSGTLSNLIRSIPLPKGNQVGVIPSILGARQGIASAVEELRSTGSITKATMDAIVASVGTADESVRGYLESMIRLQAANQTTRDAQAELNKVTEKYNELLKPINAEIAGISEEQQQLADEQKKSLLQLVLKDPNATLAEKRQAQLEIERLDAEKRRRALLAEQAVAVEGAKDTLDAAKTAEQLAQEDFDARKALIIAQTEQNNLLKEQLRLLESLNKEAKEGPKPTGGKPGPTPFSIKPFDLGDFIPGDILSKWEAFATAFGALWAKIVEVMQPAIDAWNLKVVPAWNNLVAVITSTIPAIETAIAQLVAFAVVEMGISLPVVFDNLAKSLGSLARIWEKHHQTILRITVFIFQAIFATISGTLIIISGIVAVTLAIIAGAFDFWSKVIEGDWNGAFGVMRDTVVEIMGIIGATITGVLNAAFAIFDLTTGDIKRVWGQAFAAAQLVIDTVMPHVETVVKTAVENIRLAIDTKINAAKVIIDTVLTALKLAWDTFWDAAELKVTTKVEEVRKIVDEKIKLVQGIFEVALLAITTAFAGPLTALQSFFDLVKTTWEWLNTHVFTISLPSIPGFSAPSGTSGQVNGPSSVGRGGGPSINTSTTGGSYTYAPTYVSNAPAPSAGFATMTALFG